MLPDVKSVKNRRKLLGITQKELAKQAGVSQSFIAKMESGRINPSYSHVKQILDFIEALESREREELRAKELYRKRVFSLNANDRISHAVQLMRGHEISQLPVFRGRLPVGSVTEKTIVELMARGYDSRKLSSMRVSQIMEESFPVISQETPISAISSLLHHNPAVLLSKDGNIRGIITKADIIKVIK
jgi:predicted transcriptional regulator